MESITFTLATGQKSHALYIDGSPVDAFNNYINDIARTEPANTVKSKASDLRTFFGYLNALDDPDKIAELGIGVKTGTPLLTEMILQFPHYLALGNQSPQDTLSHLAARKTNRKPTSHATNQRIISTVRSFLTKSADFQTEMQSASELGLIDLDIDPEVMFKEALFREEIPTHQRKALLRKSVIAGVISNGPKFGKSTILKARKVFSPTFETGSSVSKALSHEDALPILNETSTLRDRLYLSLIMGTGLREIEAANTLIQDIDVKNKKVLCVNPVTRPLAYGNEYESVSGATALTTAYKGRTTAETFFIEPFRTIFFETLHSYLVKERQPLHLAHKFLFVVLKRGEHRGRPLALSSDATRQYILKQCLKKVYAERGLPPPKGKALHSCRHMYGVHCLNYLVIGYRKDGTPIRGLDLNVVQRLMAHANPSSTEVYAIPDIELTQEKVNRAMQLVQSGIVTSDQKLLLNKHFGAEI
ncbi:site-specific integrase [Vibrio sp. B1FLJ16]|uniref:site-specific integrase n=1 Tax=Vibrio sp. B1FLJ16 TaxID=2751178 RepID=UPI0015F3EAB0|nr:site-specific integrase [Vibrio sp. B1FLJ16]CAD7801887.1 Phage integrase family [Vibrio sp. B1FLJ16]CAE6892156.1 Phage integrase family [Vibrio sp. B1FLJ16]